MGQGEHEVLTRSGVAEIGELSIAYEDWGDEAAESFILIMGLGGQLTTWPDGFCARLVARGYRVIRFDNRDIGLSSRITIDTPRPGRLKLLLRSQLGLKTPVPYTLVDMANDVTALMDFLGLERAHVVSASMGGMIAQVMAAEFPDRVSSLAILMSSTNQPFLPRPAPRALLGLLRLFRWPIENGTGEAYFEDTFKFLLNIRGSSYPVPDHEIEGDLRRMFARSANDPLAVHRQLMAIFGTGDLRAYARAIKARTVVIHGAEDPLMPLAAGKAVAKCIRDARLEIIPGMGHNMPQPLWDPIVDILDTNAHPLSPKRAGSRQPSSGRSARP